MKKKTKRREESKGYGALMGEEDELDGLNMCQFHDSSGEKLNFDIILYYIILRIKMGFAMQ